jgi:methanogenic corrinoid protein MtbC1
MTAIEKQIGEEIYSHIDRLTGEITALQTHHRTDISPKYDLNDAKYRAYGQHDLQQLAEALIANNPSQFARYIVWQRSMLRGHHVPDFFVELQLQTEQIALMQLLPPNQHPVILRFLQSARDALMEADIPYSSSPGVNNAIAKLATEYTNILLTGERAAAYTLITDALSNQVSIRDIYLNVFKPGLYEVGRMWQSGLITVAHEHFFTAATQFMMSEMYPQIHKNVKKNGGTAVAACVAGELHEVGLRMCADLLELAGWRTWYLGANMPAMSIIEITREKKAQLLILSMCLPINGPELRELIATVRNQLGDTVKIIIGGYSISADPVYAASFGADAVAIDAGEITAIADRLLGEVKNHARR